MVIMNKLSFYVLNVSFVGNFGGTPVSQKKNLLHINRLVY